MERRPGPHEGQAAVVGEATGTGTARAAGGEVQARRARGAETTSGRSCSPQGRTAPCPDRVWRGRPRHEEGGGLAPEPGGARTVGAHRLTGSDETTRRAITPRSGPGALGTWSLPESPDSVGPGHQGAPAEGNQRATGGLCVSTSAWRSLGRRPAGGQGQHRPGESPPAGIAGGPAETSTMVERGTHLAYRKSERWKLST